MTGYTWRCKCGTAGSSQSARRAPRCNNCGRKMTGARRIDPYYQRAAVAPKTAAAPASAPTPAPGPSAQMTRLLARYGAADEAGLLRAIRDEYELETGSRPGRIAATAILDQMLEAEYQRIAGGAYDEARP